MNYLTGICAQCRNEKDLQICRDSYFICAQCNDEIKASLEQDEPVQCVGCEKKYSWLWGRFDADQKFRCRNCIPGGLCHLCHKNPATVAVKEGERGYFACNTCANAAAE